MLTIRILRKKSSQEGQAQSSIGRLQGSDGMLRLNSVLIKR
jgi:hypothetical protein